MNLTSGDEAFVKELGRRATGKTTPGTIINTKAGSVAISKEEKIRLDEIVNRCGKSGMVDLINEFL